MSFSRGLRGCESIASAAPAPTGPWQAQVAERRGCSCKASYAKSMRCPSHSAVTPRQEPQIPARSSAGERHQPPRGRPSIRRRPSRPSVGAWRSQRFRSEDPKRVEDLSRSGTKQVRERPFLVITIDSPLLATSSINPRHVALNSEALMLFMRNIVSWS